MTTTATDEFPVHEHVPGQKPLHLDAPEPAPAGAAVDQTTASLLALIDGDPIHAADRARVINAIIATADADADRVDPNRLRRRLTDEHGQSTVYPAVIGSTFSALAARGVLVSIGWTTTAGSKSHNNGRPARVRRLDRQRLAAVMAEARRSPRRKTTSRVPGEASSVVDGQAEVALSDAMALLSGEETQP